MFISPRQPHETRDWPNEVQSVVNQALVNVEHSRLERLALCTPVNVRSRSYFTIFIIRHMFFEKVQFRMPPDMILRHAMLGYLSDVRPISLQEVFVATSVGRYVSLILCNRREDCKPRFEILTEIHDRGDVPTPVAVVGCTPDRDNRLVVKMPLFLMSQSLGQIALDACLVAFVDQLMSSGNELKSIDVIEFSSHLIAE